MTAVCSEASPLHHLPITCCYTTSVSMWSEWSYFRNQFGLYLWHTALLHLTTKHLKKDQGRSLKRWWIGCWESLLFLQRPQAQCLALTLSSSQTACNSGSRDPNALFWPPWAMHPQVHTQRHMGISTIIIIINFHISLLNNKELLGYLTYRFYQRCCPSVQ